jgi:hypothetical protein
VGTFAETSVVDYRSSFAYQGKQNSVFDVRLQQTHSSLPLPFSVYSKQTVVCRYCFPFAANKRRLTFSFSSALKNGLVKGQASEILILFLAYMDRPICEYETLPVQIYFKGAQNLRSESPKIKR